LARGGQAPERAQRRLGHPRSVVADDTDTYVESEPGRVERYELHHRALCRGATVAEAV